MNPVKKLAAAGGTLAVIATSTLLIGGATGAKAATAGVLAFTGQASSITCSNNLPAGAPGATCPAGGGNGVPVVGGVGTYAFGPAGTPWNLCELNAAGCTLNSTGSYTNVVCGTGIASGNATVDGVGGNAYTIVFVAGAGVIVSTNPFAGVVDISPSTGGVGAPGSGVCVTQFDVAGVAAGLVNA